MATFTINLSISFEATSVAESQDVVNAMVQHLTDEFEGLKVSTSTIGLENNEANFSLAKLMNGAPMTEQEINDADVALKAQKEGEQNAS